MELYQLPQLADKCRYGRPPLCAHACPLGVDVIAMMEKIPVGMTGAAYTAYAKSVVFPGIVSHLCHAPCQAVCVRREVDAPVALGALERFLWRKHGAKPDGVYYIPRKSKRVLVVGGNLCGMTCAWKLAERGYRVVLTEQGDCLAPEVSALLPPEVLSAEVARMGRQPHLELCMQTDGHALDAAAFDAVLWARARPQSPAPEGNIICADSSAMGTPVDAIAHGIALFYGVESLLKIGRVTFPEKPCHAPHGMPADGIAQRRPAAVPPGGYGETDAREEAARCIRCTCTGCLDVCDVLRHYETAPPKTLLQVSDTINKTLMTSKTALGPMMGCTQCGLCAPECPEEIDFREVFLQSRRRMHRSGELPSAHYQYWLDDMRFSNREGAFELMPSEAGFVFFPGCQMGASNPDYVLHAYRWLREHLPRPTGLSLRCCGAPAHWAGDEAQYHSVLRTIHDTWDRGGRPVFILACATCITRFQAHLPDVTVKSLWEIMAQHMPPRPKQNACVSVFDPCTSKARPDDQRHVRQLVAAMGYDIKPLPSDGEKARCCGYGGLAGARHPSLTQDIRRRNAALGEAPYVTYCTNCQDSFRMEGKASHYLLELLFPALTPAPPLPDLGTRRTNRIGLKAQLQSTYQGIEPQEDGQHIVPVIPRAVLDRMNHAMIHSDNVRQVIEYGESTGCKVLHPTSGHLSCHQRQGNLTFWVEYAPREDGRFDVFKVYAHRMVIEEQEGGR